MRRSPVALVTVEEQTPTPTDLRAQFRRFYRPSEKRVEVVDVPEFRFLMIDGRGDPNKAAAFPDAIAALYGVAYTLKFTLRKAPQPRDYPVMPLEALWSTPGSTMFDAGQKDRWVWTAMIVQPDFITDQLVREAAEAVAKKRPSDALQQLRYEPFHEGRAAQILYRGPYGDEGPVIERLHAFIEQNGHRLRGKHHEIYLSDPRRSKPENLRTILRQPFE